MTNHVTRVPSVYPRQYVPLLGRYKPLRGDEWISYWQLRPAISLTIIASIAKITTASAEYGRRAVELGGRCQELLYARQWVWRAYWRS